MSNIGNLDVFDQVTSAYRLTINPVGNIGIGTTTPYFKFQVESNVAGVARFGSSNTGNTGNIAIINASNYNYGIMGVVIANGTPSGDVYGLGYTSNANSSFNNVLNWTSTGSVAIGTTDPQGYKLAVNGSAIATSMTVKLYANWPDYVFKPTYELPSLLKVKNYIDQNQHLPEMPSEEEVIKNGVNLGEMNRILVKKVEELTLYLIEKDKQLAKQQQLLAIHEAKLKRFGKQLSRLERIKKQ